MISEEKIDLLVERLVSRIDKANTYFLKSIGSSIKKIRNLTPSQAQQLVQILKYGGNYEEIVKKIAQYTDMNVRDIDNIFSAYAKEDQRFYEKFYKYRNVPFVPFQDNMALRRQTMALANIAKNEMYNMFRTNVLGYSINGEFVGLKDTYIRAIDEALLNVGQGKETFDRAMTRILKDIGSSGLKTIDYASGRAVRADSVVRMHLRAGLRELHNENQKIIGQEIDADGVEITVHANPAPDHEASQGHQFSNEEYEKLNNGELARDYNGKMLSLDHDDNGTFRPISELNCYHNIFSIVLGVSKPEYSETQLKQIINDNHKGFDYEGKHYTNYEGEQLQRSIERKIREQKDTQILARASDNKELILESQGKITQLTNKYRELSKASKLPTRMDRMRVSGYKRVAIN